MRGGSSYDEPGEGRAGGGRFLELNGETLHRVPDRSAASPCVRPLPGTQRRSSRIHQASPVRLPLGRGIKFPISQRRHLRRVAQPDRR